MDKICKATGQTREELQQELATLGIEEETQPEHTNTPMVQPAQRLLIKETDLAAQHFADELCTGEGSMQGVRFCPGLF